MFLKEVSDAYNDWIDWILENKIQQKQDYCKILLYYNLKELLSILKYCKM